MGPIAGAREGAFLSEAAVQKLLERWDGEGDLDLRGAVVEGPVAAERQAAVVTGIAELAAEHEILLRPGRTMLRGLAYLEAEDEQLARSLRIEERELKAGERN